MTTPINGNSVTNTQVTQKKQKGFNWAKFGQNMQKLSQTMLQGGFLMAMNDMRGSGCHGGFGRSIWTGHNCGCNTGFYGMGMGMPSPYLNHPMYAANTTNPYLLQSGLVNAEAFGATMYQQALAAIKAQQAQLPTTTTPQITDSRLGNEFETNLKDKGEFTFMTENWTKLNEKENLTQAEKDAISEAYNKGIKDLGASWLKHLDEKHGNKDNKLSLDEFTTYVKDKFGNKYSNDDIKQIYNAIDSDETKNSIESSEISALITKIDTDENDKLDGKISNSDIENYFNSLLKKDEE